MESVLRFKVIQSIRLYTQLGEKFREVFFLNADLFFSGCSPAWLMHVCTACRDKACTYYLIESRYMVNEKYEFRILTCCNSGKTSGL